MTSDEFLKLYNDYDQEIEGEEGVTLVESGDWEIDYKDYAFKKGVYKIGSQYFAIYEQRSGSYYTDYCYDDPSCEEVFPQEVTRIEYVTKKP